MTGNTTDEIRPGSGKRGWTIKRMLARQRDAAAQTPSAVLSSVRRQVRPVRGSVYILPKPIWLCSRHTKGPLLRAVLHVPVVKEGAFEIGPEHGQPRRAGMQERALGLIGSVCTAGDHCSGKRGLASQHANSAQSLL